MLHQVYRWPNRYRWISEIIAKTAHQDQWFDMKTNDSKRKVMFIAKNTKNVHISVEEKPTEQLHKFSSLTKLQPKIAIVKHK